MHKRFSSRRALVVGLCFLFVLTPMLVGSPVIAAQPEFTLLEYTYGGELNDVGYAVIEVSSGGFVIAGTTVGPTFYDNYLYVVRTDEDGTLLWEYTREAPGLAVGSDVIECHDGGFAIAGLYAKSTTIPQYGDMLLVKLDANGQFEWEGFYGAKDASEWAFAVVELDSGGFVLAGTGSEDTVTIDMFLVGTDERGTQLWEQYYGGESYDEARAIVQDRDGNLAIAGCYGGYGGAGYMWLMKTDTQGRRLDDVVYPEFEGSWAYAIVECANGDFALAGSAWNDFQYYQDYALLRTNNAGDLLWAHMYERETVDYGYSLVETPEGDFVIAGYTNYYDMLLIGTNADGDKQWELSYGDYVTAYALSIVNCRDGGFAITGGISDPYYLPLDMWLVRLFIEIPTIEGLIEDVETLETDGLLNQGQTRSLVQKLEAALQLQEQGQLIAACYLLQGFIKQVEAYLSAGILTEVAAQPLIEYATTLINEICQA